MVRYVDALTEFRVLILFPKVHPSPEQSMQRCHAAIVIGDVTLSSIST